MKKILVAILALTTALSMTACSGSKPAEQETSSAGEASSAVSESSSEASSEETSSEKSEAPAGDTTPEQAAAAAFDAFKALDQEKIAEYFIGGENVNLSNMSPVADGEKLSKLFVENFSYELGEVTEDGDSAVIKTKVTNANMSTLFNDLMAFAMEQAVTGETDEAKINQAVEDKVIELVGTAKENPVTAEVDVRLTKANGVWKVEMDENLLDAVMGGLVSGMAEMMEQMAGALTSAAE
ncbi:hypothetical protein [Provencibacterium massiliense]|uniref:hypothetical protein n=1 Tax=Provencibacterium massiliense TaxID=1841868 RepID=UPI0009A85A81|nr:hypothetical protein [Provencibacterium massiliense]RGB69748.1 hypothetical protein DW086_01015 [Harryflintia acetispora]